MTPIPVYITDCKADCLVFAHKAEDLANLALQAGVLAAALAIVALFSIVFAVGFRRHG